MKYLLCTVGTIALLAMVSQVFAQDIAVLSVTPEGIASDGYIDNGYAFCIPAATGM